MFTHPTDKDNHLVRVEFSAYSKNHFCKNFEKKYRGRQWTLAQEAIIADIGHIKTVNNNIQKTQQVDELWHSNAYWIFKYDFSIPGTKISPKASGNRCIIFLDAAKNTADILIIYNKTDLPKNLGEQQWIIKVLQAEFSDYLAKAKY